MTRNDRSANANNWRTGTLALSAALLLGLAGSANAGVPFEPRDVQMVDVDFTTNVVELHNFGAVSADLSGWRFCTHDEDEIRIYSDVAGLNGTTINAGASLFVHLDGDAPAQADSLNFPGPFASPFDPGAYGLSLYTGSLFNDGNTMADHLQWSPNGVDDGTADERSDEAVAGGVWTAETDWIATLPDGMSGNPTATVTLNGPSGGLVLHGPPDYTVPEPTALLGHAAALGTLMVLRRRQRRLTRRTSA